jgi:hypothetical protein
MFHVLLDGSAAMELAILIIQANRVEKILSRHNQVLRLLWRVLYLPEYE